MTSFPTSDELLNSPSFVVCLRRNKKRFFYTRNLLNKAGFKKVYPFEAVDGVSMRDSKDEWHHRWHPLANSLGLPSVHQEGMHGGGGQFGITMSLLTLFGWVSISSKHGMMIFEDDALPRPDFGKIFPQYWSAIAQEGADMVYIGGQLHPNEIKDSSSTCGYYTTQAAQCMHALYITKLGAKKILDFMPFVAEARHRHRLKYGNNSDWTPIDNTLKLINSPRAVAHFFSSVGMDKHKRFCPDFKCVSFIGSKIPVEGSYEGTPWENRSDGIIHQNADLGSNLHGLDISRMRKETETAQEGKDVFHESMFKIDEETGEGYIET